MTENRALAAKAFPAGRADVPGVCEPPRCWHSCLQGRLVCVPQPTFGGEADGQHVPVLWCQHPHRALISAASVTSQKAYLAARGGGPRRAESWPTSAVWAPLT